MTPTATPTDAPLAFPSAQALHHTLSTALRPQVLEVLDESAAHAGHAGAQGRSAGTHFRVRIGGAAFAGLSRVAAHRLVYDALRPYMDAGLHALAIELVPTTPV